MKEYIDILYAILKIQISAYRTKLLKIMYVSVKIKMKLYIIMQYFMILQVYTISYKFTYIQYIYRILFFSILIRYSQFSIQI